MRRSRSMLCICYSLSSRACVGGWELFKFRAVKIVTFGPQHDWCQLRKTPFLLCNCVCIVFEQILEVKEVNLVERLQRIRRPQRCSGWSILLALHLENWHQQCWEMLLGLHREVQHRFCFFLHSCREWYATAFTAYGVFLLSLWKECFGFHSCVMPWQDTSPLAGVAFVGIFSSCCVFTQIPSVAFEYILSPGGFGSHDNRHCGPLNLTGGSV